MPIFRLPFLLFVLHSVGLVVASRNSSSWLTLTGNAPLVIARGGFPGIFPDSSFASYQLALNTSLSNVILWCDVQLTKDGAGICFPNIKLENSSDISSVFRNSRIYLVNGQSTRGWFSVDYTLDDLKSVYLMQGIYYRTNKFDGNRYNILTVEDVAIKLKPPGLWLNIQYDAFYRQHKLSMRSYILSASRRFVINYISSPEVAFLSTIAERFKGSKTKLIFRFLGSDEIEPSTNQTYGSLLKNLKFIKKFASGILVPKNYIWPVNTALYLQHHTSIVSDAHREGLEVFASDFANDVVFSYNYSYNPLAEYLSFIDNGDFSVDGVLSDFPVTPSAAIDCFSHISNKSSGKAMPIVISHNGASGVYPGCTDLAYKQAVEDGADVIDCSVQMTKDGIPICLGSIDLLYGTTVAQSQFNSRSSNIPEIQETPGIFTFSLTWKEIQSLKPAIRNPFMDYNLFRNPAYKNAGSFLSLDDFLAFAKSKSLSGVLISIENAAYIVENLGLSVIDAVVDALKKSGHNNQTNQKIMIQSTNSSVLIKFKEKTNYQLVYKIDEVIRDADKASIMDIKQFAHSLVIRKSSIFPLNSAFLTGVTKIVSKLHSFNLTVYTSVFRNEFVSSAWDFYSDPVVEINSFVMGAGIDGVITDFPGTAIMYRKNRCLNRGDNIPSYMRPVQPGNLFQAISAEYLPLAEAPSPVLTDSDVAEPPLPHVIKKPSRSGPAASPMLSAWSPIAAPSSHL
ncbi:PREDICTED: glycerophosphodiester phosphodiesterase GDPDL4-like [Nelumbo nucifera]|uniref:glycerophosphodiester phosphodiesterase n=2 Tax=Nelumbo nucifera TaxID=4432 RepID=A0A822XTB6_NELNU|nr:PREDICTED: glycerophosphodiester phosphodiesterase GDPDL4-like [Nelumbo nucifera]DAD23577.1 TPA_asm: hypothetical protein HUJ06_025040 [Nelumbo nucifera]